MTKKELNEKIKKLESEVFDVYYMLKYTTLGNQEESKLAYDVWDKITDLCEVLEIDVEE